MTEISALLTGAALGLSQGCSPGPHSALVITRTLNGSLWEGTKVAFAPVLATFPIVALVVPSVSLLANNNALLGVLALLGALYLIYIAYKGLEKVSLQENRETTTTTGSSFKVGFIATCLSPHPYLFWSTAGASLLLTAYKFSYLSAVSFLLSFLGVFFAAKLLLAIFAHILRRAMNATLLNNIVRSLSIVLALFAIVLARDGLKLMGVW